MPAALRTSLRASGGDPFLRASGIGARAERRGRWLGLIGTGSLHGAILLLAIARPVPAREPAAPLAEVERAPPPAPPPPPPPPRDPPPPDPTPPPPPQPRQQPPAPLPPSDDPYDDVDTPARAAKVLTAPDSAPDTHPTIATSDADGPGYGLVAGDGSGDSPTFDPRAHVGARGARPAPIASSPPPRDYSRPASVIYGIADECEFPPSTDEPSAVVTVAIDVGPDGHATGVDVLIDPGHGFGAAARACAMRRPYRPALDASGRPTHGKTGPVRIRFMR